MGAGKPCFDRELLEYCMKWVQESFSGVNQGSHQDRKYGYLEVWMKGFPYEAPGREIVLLSKDG